MMERDQSPNELVPNRPFFFAADEKAPSQSCLCVSSQEPKSALHARTYKIQSSSEHNLDDINSTEPELLYSPEETTPIDHRLGLSPFTTTIQNQTAGADQETVLESTDQPAVTLPNMLHLPSYTEGLSGQEEHNLVHCPEYKKMYASKLLRLQQALYRVLVSDAAKRNCVQTNKRKMRPLSGYNIFFQVQRAQIIGSTEHLGRTSETVKQRRRKKPHNKVSFEELARRIGSQWRGLSAREKSVYEAQAKAQNEQRKATE